MSKNISYLSGRKGLENNLFDGLGQTQEQSAPVSKETLAKLADEFLIGKANTYGAVTFYDFLKPENKGKDVYVCNGSACLCAGTQDELKSELSKHVSEEKIGHMTCLGRCHENSAFQYKGLNYSNLNTDQIKELLNGKSEIPSDDYHVDYLGKQVLTQAFTDIDSYYSVWKKVLNLAPETVLHEISVAGIRGRGGAGFPMAFKLEACKNEESETKFIVCNADEGDPGAYSDRYLMEQQPHSVLLGMMIAGYVIGANWGVLYIRGEYPESIQIINKAIKDIRDKGLIGENVLNSGFDFDFKVINAQGAYICGEETALLSSIEGQRPEVRVRPPYPTQQGLFNLPTVVNNVETLAALPFILNEGGASYASIGTKRSSGTKLVSLDSFFNKPGIYEVEMGTPLSVVVNTLGGGFKERIKALHIGGPLGGLVPVSKVEDLSIDFESFSQNGFLLGHASVLCVPDTYPLIAYLEHLFEFTAAESCGKCFPCRIGSVRGQEMIDKARTSDYKINRQLLNDLLDTLEQGSLCALGGGVPLPIKNALEYFEEELAVYFEA